MSATNEARGQTDALAFLQGMVDDEHVRLVSAEPSPEPSLDPIRGPIAEGAT